MTEENQQRKNGEEEDEKSCPGAGREQMDRPKSQEGEKNDAEKEEKQAQMKKEKGKACSKAKQVDIRVEDNAGNDFLESQKQEKGEAGENNIDRPSRHLRQSRLAFSEWMQGGKGSASNDQE